MGSVDAVQLQVPTVNDDGPVEKLCEAATWPTRAAAWLQGVFTALIPVAALPPWPSATSPHEVTPEAVEVVVLAVVDVVEDGFTVLDVVEDELEEVRAVVVVGRTVVPVAGGRVVPFSTSMPGGASAVPSGAAVGSSLEQPAATSSTTRPVTATAANDARRRRPGDRGAPSTTAAVPASPLGPTVDSTMALASWPPTLPGTTRTMSAWRLDLGPWSRPYGRVPTRGAT